MLARWVGVVDGGGRTCGGQCWGYVGEGGTFAIRFVFLLPIVSAADLVRFVCW